jgi:hypothetical protein
MINQLSKDEAENIFSKQKKKSSKRGWIRPHK